MKQFLSMMALVLAAIPVFSQSYFTAGGVRLGSDWGLTLKQKVAKRVTVEGILQNGFTNDNTTVSVLLEKHNPLIGKRLNIYYGGGMHKTWIPNEQPDVDLVDPYGISLIAGAEFTLGRLNFSFDYKPLINLTGDVKQFQSQGGLSMRYVFVKKVKTKKKKQNWKFWDQNNKNKKKKKKKKSGLFG
ncbi:MAG: hypothetical protein AAFO94_15805 [Bacteroidota bacterium]